jgi:NADH dehydrogenase FAD-containing subunit
MVVRSGRGERTFRVAACAHFMIMTLMSFSSVIGFQRCGSTIRSTTRHARSQDASLSCAASRSSGADPLRIIIVGGGLAGLSTAFHLLEQRQERKITPPLKLTILDKHPVGMGGTLAVAGGYVLVLAR